MTGIRIFAAAITCVVAGPCSNAVGMSALVLCQGSTLYGTFDYVPKAVNVAVNMLLTTGP